MAGSFIADTHMTYDLAMDVKATKAGQNSTINPADALIDQEINSSWGSVAFSLVAYCPNESGRPERQWKRVDLAGNPGC
jgi:hypothetical protein